MGELLNNPEFRAAAEQMSEAQIAYVEAINSGRLAINLADTAIDSMKKVFAVISKRNPMMADFMAWSAYMGAVLSACRRPTDVAQNFTQRSTHKEVWE